MAHDREQADSVFDFLYADLPRLGTLLTQFGDDGVLTELTRQTDDTTEAGGMLGPRWANLNSKDGARKSLSRKFDPRWIVPLRFLDVAQGMLHSDITTAALGQLVITEGAVGITDLGMIKTLWGDQFVRSTIAASIPQENIEAAMPNRQERRRQGQKTVATSRQPDMSDFVGALLSMLPHAVQATLFTSDYQQLWGTLSPESINGSSADLLLKHGTAIAGRWHMVSILDALPATADPDPLQYYAREIQKLTPIGQILGNITPVLEAGFSRPILAYGVTPLIIMRKIDSRHAEAVAP